MQHESPANCNGAPMGLQWGEMKENSLSEFSDLFLFNRIFGVLWDFNYSKMAD